MNKKVSNSQESAIRFVHKTAKMNVMKVSAMKKCTFWNTLLCIVLFIDNMSELQYFTR